MMLLRIFFLLIVLPVCCRMAQAQNNVFHSTYSSAFIVTPVNTDLSVVPKASFEPVFSSSAEFTFRRADRLAVSFAGGYYPFYDHNEILGSFGIRRFGIHAEAPVGGYWGMHVLGGAAKHDGTAEWEPLFGLGMRLGSIRTTRFSDFCFEYGADANLILTGGQTQFRASLFFGIGFLLGKAVHIGE